MCATSFAFTSFSLLLAAVAISALSGFCFPFFCFYFFCVFLGSVNSIWRWLDFKIFPLTPPAWQVPVEMENRLQQLHSFHVMAYLIANENGLRVVVVATQTSNHYLCQTGENASKTAKTSTSTQVLITSLAR